MSEGFSESELMAELPRLRRFAAAVMGGVSEDDREDVVSIVLMRAWRYRDKFRNGSQLHTWLFTILIRCAHTEGAHIKRRRLLEVPLIEEFDAESRTELSYDAVNDLIEIMDAERGLMSIDQEEREAIIIHARGDTLASHASRLGKSPCSLRQRVKTARLELESLCRAS